MLGTGESNRRGCRLQHRTQHQTGTQGHCRSFQLLWIWWAQLCGCLWSLRQWQSLETFTAILGRTCKHLQCQSSASASEHVLLRRFLQLPSNTLRLKGTFAPLCGYLLTTSECNRAYCNSIGIWKSFNVSEKRSAQPAALCSLSFHP